VRLGGWDVVGIEWRENLIPLWWPLLKERRGLRGKEKKKSLGISPGRAVFERKKKKKREKEKRDSPDRFSSNHLS